MRRESESPLTPNGIWQRQFDRELDFEEAPVRASYALCTTPRCGSHFFGHKLQATGTLGYPLEYFHPSNWQEWRRRATAIKGIDTLAFIETKRTSPNGIFGAKIHFEHLERFLSEVPHPLSWEFIHLQRNDLLGQAISFARAQQTNSWISDMPLQADAHYDYALVAKKLKAICTWNASWTAFFQRFGITPLKVTYEQAARSPQETVRLVGKHLGVDVAGGHEVPETFKPQNQSDGVGNSDDWRTRFIEESRGRLEAGQDVLDVRNCGAVKAVLANGKRWARALLSVN